MDEKTDEREVFLRNIGKVAYKKCTTGKKY